VAAGAPPPAERALATVVATSYLLGVSTRRVEKLAESLGVTKLSKSQVSVMAAELDEMVTQFRSRPLDAGPYAFVWIDALTQKVREGGRTVNVHALIATGVNADGKREVLGWTWRPRRTARGGWRSCAAWLPAACPGCSWSPATATTGCATRLPRSCPAPPGKGAVPTNSRNLATKVPKSAQPWVSTLVRTIFE
jgi:putative transposase